VKKVCDNHVFFKKHGKNNQEKLLFSVPLRKGFQRGKFPLIPQEILTQNAPEKVVFSLIKGITDEWRGVHILLPLYPPFPIRLKIPK